MQVGFKSDKGVKRYNNEDACFVMLHDRVYVVADGVGGSNSGEIASRTAVSQTANYILDNPIDQCQGDDQLRTYFENCINYVNKAVYDKGNAHVENEGMATTLVMSYARKGRVYVANVGDSRAYIYRDKQLVQVTEDHTYVNTLVKAGIISEDEAKTHENKNMITRAIGADEYVEADFYKIEIELGDIIIICTDGLYGEVDTKELSLILDKKLSMSETCAELVSLANKKGGHDNITVVSLRVTEEDVNE